MNKAIVFLAETRTPAALYTIIHLNEKEEEEEEEEEEETKKKKGICFGRWGIGGGRGGGAILGLLGGGNWLNKDLSTGATFGHAATYRPDDEGR